jgi:ABC-type molybdate transport system substrate-binding protein
MQLRFIFIILLLLTNNSYAAQTRIKLAIEKPLLFAINEIAKDYLLENNVIFDMLYINDYTSIYKYFEQDSNMDVVITSNNHLLELLQKKYGTEIFGIAKDKLALYVDQDSPIYVNLKDNSNFSMSDLLTTITNVANIVCGNFDDTIDGMHTKAALEEAQVLHKIVDRLVLVKDDEAIRYLTSKSKTVGIMLRNTEKLTSDDMKIISIFKDYDIIYNIAVLKNVESKAETLSFIEFLRTKSAQATLEKHGFIIEK